MDLILNGRSHGIDTSDCANLAELVAVVERVDTGEEDHVVVSVEVDGQALPPEELSNLEARSLDGVASVSIQRRPTRAVAVSVLEQGADYTGQITAAIGKTVENFRAGRSDLGNGVLADVTDSLTILTGITNSVASILIEESQILADLQGKIFPWLEELFEAQSEEDPIRIADLLEYEITPRVAEWGAVMRAMATGETASASLSGGSISN